MKTKQLDALHWDYESYPWSIITSGDFVPRLAESWKRLISLHQEKMKLVKFWGKKLAPSAWEPLSRYRQDVRLFGFPSSLDQEDSPSLPGTEIFSPSRMTADPWETWGMEASISCTKEEIWQICSETNPGECRRWHFTRDYHERNVFSDCRWWKTVFLEGCCSLTSFRL